MHLTYLIKQLIGIVAMPLPLGLLLLIAGAWLRLVGRRRWSIALWTSAVALVYLASIGPVANALLLPLEGRYPPLTEQSNLPPVHFLLVLGSGYAPRDGIPVTAALDGESLSRIAEGVRLMRRLTGAKLIVSGGADIPQKASALGYAQFAVEFGIPPASILTLTQPRDTQEEAAALVGLIGTEPFILVTSAYHMPRAMRLMQLAGAHPIPAPTQQLAPRHMEFGPGAWIPRAGSLRKTEYALHEYLGLVAAR